MWRVLKVSQGIRPCIYIYFPGYRTKVCLHCLCLDFEGSICKTNTALSAVVEAAAAVHTRLPPLLVDHIFFLSLLILRQGYPKHYPRLNSHSSAGIGHSLRLFIHTELSDKVDNARNQSCYIRLNFFLYYYFFLIRLSTDGTEVVNKKITQHIFFNRWYNENKILFSTRNNNVKHFY